MERAGGAGGAGLRPLSGRCDPGEAVEPAAAEDDDGGAEVPPVVCEVCACGG